MEQVEEDEFHRKNNDTPKWSLFKKLALTGAAIASAPVVAPPLLLFSTLGLALAFPFGLFFAGFACTDKLMMTLLSPSRAEEERAEEKREGVEEEEGVENEKSREGEGEAAERKIEIEPSSAEKIEVAREEKSVEREGEAATEEKENKEEKEGDEAKSKKKGKSKKSSSGSKKAG